MPRMFQINEDDLADLERTLPQLMDAMVPVMDNRVRTQLRQVRRIIGDVRWGYGPPTDVTVVRADCDQTE